MLIDTSYFVAGLNIPDKSNAGINSLLTYYINKFEVEILREALGMDLYRNFMTALGQSNTGYANVSNGKASPTIDQRWINLLNGVEYIGLDSRRHKWQGFIAVQDDTSPPKSLIANYVYYQYIKNASSITTGVGEVVGTADNAINVSNHSKAMIAWNELCEWLTDFIWYMDYSIAYDINYYPGWILANRFRLIQKFKKINSLNI